MPANGGNHRISGEYELKNAAERLVRRLKDNRKTLATAESCTGGLISSWITAIPGASDVFLEGLTPYRNEAKIRWLAVREETLERYGAVSESCVREMLQGLIEKSGADAGIAVSGIAGPGGGTDEKPVGTVFLGVTLGENTLIRRELFSGNRDEIRKAAALTAMNTLKNLLKEEGNHHGDRSE